MGSPINTSGQRRTGDSPGRSPLSTPRADMGGMGVHINPHAMGKGGRTPESLRRHSSEVVGQAPGVIPDRRR
jgi:hypothetical protein